MAKTLKFRNSSRKPSPRNTGQYQAVTTYDPRDLESPPHSKPALTVRKPLAAQTEAQGMYLASMQTHELIFGIGPAGTGKTYCAASYAADLLLDRKIDKIIVTRPNVEVGNSLGFLPGELEEKFSVYLEPFRQVMIERMGRTHYEYSLKSEKISPRPLAYMRGATFRDAFVILDEAQNTTPAEMKMFLTRIGENCITVIDGDPAQCDLKGPSGLIDAVNRLQHLKSVAICEFTEEDIVRSGLVRDVLLAYRN